MTEKGLNYSICFGGIELVELVEPVERAEGANGIFIDVITPAGTHLPGLILLPNI